MDEPIFSEEFIEEAEKQELAIRYGVNHLLSSNWTPEEFKKAIEEKEKYE